ncbi:MAG: RNA 2',3'-cyclic phosphodiesterase [Desulfobacterales bacterium]|nr:RNA 2',3'-cyclic phosphodiesterase [Desulfobacterales bacterium]
MPETFRSFIAVNIPDPVISAIREVQGGMRARGLKVKWVRPENIHLTLKFLGEIPSADVEDVGRAMAETLEGRGPLTLSARGLGCFPGLKRARVIWVGLAGEVHPLIEYQEAMDQALAGIGLPREKRPFKGHLTLARIKGRVKPGALAAAMEAFGDFESQPFTVKEIILFKSQLTPAGPIYTALRRTPL